MAGIIRKRALPRRTFLRAAGACLALPPLEAMTPALSGSGPEAPRRYVFVFYPNGVKLDDWRPQRTGRNFVLPRTLRPLQPLRERVQVLSGLTLNGGRALGDGPGDHARAAASFLTAAHPKKTGGADIFNGQSVDQALAGLVGKDLPFASLELGMEAGRRAGRCDSGYSCAYTTAVSWKDPTTPLAKETRPREVFARLFGAPQDAADRARQAARKRRRGRVMDLLGEEYRALRRTLGGGDRAKLEHYADAVHDLERRLEHLEREGPDPEVDPAFLDEAKGSYQGRLDAMYRLIGLALQTGQTRVVTFMLGNAGSNRSYRMVDVRGGHHTISHHGKDRTKLEQIGRIDRFHLAAFSRFLGGLAETEVEGGDLLRSTAILYGSGLSDGNRHDHGDLPLLLAGELGGALKPGVHRRFPKETPLANLYLWMLRGEGARRAAFADSSGVLF